MAKDWRKIAEASGIGDIPDGAQTTLDALERVFRPMAQRLTAVDDIGVTPVEESEA